MNRFHIRATNYTNVSWTIVTNITIHLVFNNRTI